MGVVTGERSFHKVQIGAEATEGLLVAATLLYPAESSSIIELDRPVHTPEEDHGELAPARGGRSSYGVRQATMPLKSDLCFEDFIRLLESALAGGVSPSNPSAGAYLWTYACDNTTDTVKSKTIEEGDNLAVYAMRGALISRLRLSFDALNPGAAAPWTVEATFIGRDKVDIGTFTSSLDQAADRETAMGHLTRLFLGTTGTAFGSLAEVSAVLLSGDITIETGITLRKQGGTTDAADGHGRGKVKVTTTLVLEQKATAKAALWDPFEASPGDDPVIPPQRARLLILGTPLAGTNEQETITITGGPTGGSFTITYAAQTTGAIAFNATAAQVQHALQLLSTIGSGNVKVSGAAGGPWIITFRGTLGFQNITPVTTTDSLTGGTDPATAVTTNVAGVAGVYKQIAIDQQVELDAIPIQEANGSTRYSVQLRAVKDATLASVIQIAVQNGQAT